PAEIERARLSGIDLDIKDSQAYLRAAKAESEAGKTDKALEFCRRAASLQPDVAEPYANALVYIESSKTVDSDATVWAVGNLLGRDWSGDNDEFHNKARAALDTVKKKLSQESRPADARRIEEVLNEEHRRDLVIELAWDGDADLDLRVIEPIGTTSSAMQKQTPAGSLLTSDSLKERKETYVVREAFNGSYEVKVDRVWGRTTTGKAQVKVIRHQGTPDQFVEYHSIDVEKPEPLKVSLTGGRRTELAYVPPPSRSVDPAREKVAPSLERSINRLRALADPTFTGTEAPPKIGRVGGVGTVGAGLEPVRDGSGVRATNVAFTTKVDSLPGSADLTAQTEIKVKRNGDTEVRVKVTPVYETSRLSETPVIDNPLIPGGK
ncbi:MAG: hypothetical protein ACJ8F7_19405, partial [Gemmataceae bacterium]